ncbi:MAG TPA: hypothetical protein VIL92_06935 [Gaiellaceae bacterium]|jgi:hypothetical protein
MSFILGLLDRLIAAGKGVPGLRRDQKRMAILQAMLEDSAYEWRSVSTLARSVGLSDEKTRDLLIAIGARASAGGGDEIWALTSRVGASGTQRR